MICSFIGHRDTPNTIRETLHQTLCKLIENECVDCFYVGHQGDFDRLVYLELRELQKIYHNIQYRVVLAYYNHTREKCEFEEGETLYPFGLESVPCRYAISRRNRWLVAQSEFLVAYVNREFGNAADILRVATRKGIKILNLAK